MTDATQKPVLAQQNSYNQDVLNRLQKETFDYFLHEVNPANGLIADKTQEGIPASISATGFALTAYPVGVERSFWSREDAVSRTLTTLRFFHNSSQGKHRNDTGYKGFYYHFLDMNTGQRAWNSELSTIDTAILLAGILTCGQYFNHDTADENEIQTLADSLYRRVNWKWALDNGATINHSWTPEKGFSPYRWEGYNEALLLYILGLGSPTFPLSEISYSAWTASYAWRSIYGIEHLYAGPLFIHQFPQLWLDLANIQDEFMLTKDTDYFENSRRATYVHQQYAIHNPMEFKEYHEHSWGITASDGPGPDIVKLNGIERHFFGYMARGAPFGPDDGTLAPWVVVASLPFAPDVVMPTINYFVEDLHLKEQTPYGFKATFNPTYPDESHGKWVSHWHYGINQGPIVLMIENYRTGLLWKLMRNCPYVVQGLRRAGFQGDWL